ncbi:MAG: hypothetical protein OEV48_07125 [Acidobacteriota bacterium]|nr:hypothetical protein [Acidobacteriota bacterium]
MNRLLRIFASARLTLGALGFLVVYSILAVWAPDTPLENILGPSPFSAPVFLACVLLLFLCTLSCTWLRTGTVLSLRQGKVPAVHIELRAARHNSLEKFLHEHGFRGKGDTRWRNRPALWAGWLLHLALLVLMVGVVIQLVFHDGGAFEVAVGETVSLAESGIVFDRTQGSIAPSSPPDLRVRLVAFDAHQHQPGFAPDRRSRLQVETPDGSVRDLVLDRAAGARVEGTSLFQAVPTGVALVLELEGGDFRAIHLQTEGERFAAADLTLPGGGQARIMVEAERSFDSRRGSGPLTIRFERDGVETEVARGDSIEFGNTGAKLVDLVRWSGFTYVRSPGMPAVFTGFTLVLAACVLLIFPSGVAYLDTCDGSAIARVWLTRGSAVMEVAWQRWRGESKEIATTGPAVPPSRGRKDSSWSHNQ